MTKPCLLSPTISSSEPVSPSLCQGYSSDPTSPNPAASVVTPGHSRPGSLGTYQNTLLCSEPSLPTTTATDTLDLAVGTRRYLGCEGRNVVSYENVNVDQINQLCNEGYAKAAVIRALIISRNNTNLTRDILQVNEPVVLRISHQSVKIHCPKSFSPV